MLRRWIFRLSAPLVLALVVAFCVDISGPRRPLTGRVHAGAGASASAPRAVRIRAGEHDFTWRSTQPDGAEVIVDATVGRVSGYLYVHDVKPE